MKNKQIIKLQPNSKISINENNELIIETEIDPCEGVIYTTMYNNGNPARIAKGTLEVYLKNNTYSKNGSASGLYKMQRTSMALHYKFNVIQSGKNNTRDKKRSLCSTFK